MTRRHPCADEVPSSNPRRESQDYSSPAPKVTNSSARYPVLYVQDGTEYMRPRAGAIQVADKLIEQKKVAPFIIVFVDPVDRMKEYWADDRFADFMATGTRALHRRALPHAAPRDARALLGASLGGVISIWHGLRHPDIFARVGGAVVSLPDRRRAGRLGARPARAGGAPQTALKFYLDVGGMEPILDVNRRVHVMLRAKGYPVTYREVGGRPQLHGLARPAPDALVALWK